MASNIELQFGQRYAIESLRWWIRVGVTYALDATPHDCFAGTPGDDGGEHGARNASESEPQFAHSLSETTSRALQDARWRETPETAEISSRARAQAHRHPTCVRGRTPWLTDHVNRRGPRGG